MNWRFMTWRHSHSKPPIHRWCSVPETCHTDHIVMVASSLVSFVCRRSIWSPAGRQLDSRHLDPQSRSDQAINTKPTIVKYWALRNIVMSEQMQSANSFCQMTIAILHNRVSDHCCSHFRLNIFATQVFLHEIFPMVVHEIAWEG